MVERASRHFERVIVAVLRNPQKSEHMFSAKEREEMLVECLERFDNVEIVAMSTLVVDAARAVGADVIVKGLRAISDFENEFQMAQMNEQLSGIDTLFIPTGSAYSFIASRLIREVARFGGDVSPFVPESVALRIKGRTSD